ncbi:unnamed protein product [Ceutorhynchus assimilis]|uniref:Uncharacterized protein n=1 Tax=Ceutorhynchus assimilis TaxID=467358 RepID=A0A9N9QLX4_9CUCU|nr:unnamed protein product [Ceutorhynchus assimilis]
MSLFTSLVLGLFLFVIFNKLWCFWCRSKVCLIGKTALITGGASGIGFQTALALASKGCRIIIADITNLNEAVEQIKKISNNPNIIGKHIDLRSFDSVRQFAKEILETEPKLDILLCNAGIGDYRIRTFTQDGLERTMQVNYFSHFLLTHLLLDLLKKAPSTRIIFTSSITAYVSDLTIENLNPNPDYYHGFLTKMNGGTYSNSKLCLAAAAKMFAERLKGTGVTVNTVLPGGVQTPIWSATKRDFNFIGIFVTCLVYLYGKTPEQGAQTLIHVAHSENVEGQTGQFFYEGMRFLKPLQLSEGFCKELWHKSIECTKLQAHEIKC